MILILPVVSLRNVKTEYQNGLGDQAGIGDNSLTTS